MDGISYLCNCFSNLSNLISLNLEGIIIIFSKSNK